MGRLSRRRLLQTASALGVVSTLPQVTGASGGHDGPHLEKFVQPLPIPAEREPDGRRRGATYHEIALEETEQQFHPDMPATTVWGYDGQVPGPLVSAWKGQRLALRFDNSGMPDEHLLSVDERIAGTTTENYPDYDGPVPEVRTVTHVHGMTIAPESDGQADMWESPDGVTGPRHATRVQDVPNQQPRTSTTYHDHARGISRLNIYAGLVGPYVIRSRREQSLDLPADEYDIPLVLLDRTFDEDGQLVYPDMFMPQVGGETATVNGAVWPYLEVEPRRYRFRILNPSNGRTYGLGLRNEGGHGVPHVHQFGAGHGFLEDVVAIGPGAEMDKLLIAPFERADVVVDFSDFAGETFTMTNDAEFPFGQVGGGHGGHDMDDGHGDGNGDDGHDGGHGDGDHPDVHEIMQFRVADESVRDPSADPTSLRLPHRRRTNPEAAVETRHMTMQMDMAAEPVIHLLNNRHMSDPVQHEPQLGTTEIWALSNDTMHTHPIHLHLVQFDVIGRGEDGTDAPHPNELGGKDTVRVNPGETVRIAVQFEKFTGKFPFHCHILEHEDHDMMRPFEVVAGESDHRGRGRGRGQPGKGRE